MGSNGIYPLVNIQKTMENHHFSWEIQLFQWPLSIAMWNYQSVYQWELPERISMGILIMEHHWYTYLVGGAIRILKNMSSSMGRIIPYIMENKKCLKPPTKYVHIYIYLLSGDIYIYIYIYISVLTNFLNDQWFDCHESYIFHALESRLIHR